MTATNCMQSEQAHGSGSADQNKAEHAGDCIGQGDVLQALLQIEVEETADDPEAGVVDVVEDHRACTNSQNRGNGSQAQSAHHGADNAGSRHAARGHGTNSGEHDRADQEGDQQAGNAGLLDEAGQIVDSGSSLDDGSQCAAHAGDQQCGQSHCQTAGNPAVENDLAEAFGIIAADVLVALADGSLVEGAQQHGVDHAQTQSHNLVAKDVGPAVEGRILSDSHLQEGAAGNENHGDQDGQEGSEGAGDIIAGDENILHIVGRGLLDLSHNFGNRLNELLVGPLTQNQPGQQEGDQRDHNAPADNQTQISTQQDGDSQNTGRRGNHGMGQVQAGLGESGHLAHGDVLTLGEHVGNVGGQDGGDIAEHGNGDDVSGQCGSQLQILAAEQLDEEVFEELCQELDDIDGTLQTKIESMYSDAVNQETDINM